MPLTADQQMKMQAAAAALGIPASVLGLVSPGSSPISRTQSGIQAAQGANTVSGALGGPTLSSNLSSGLGGLSSAVGLAGAGYGLYNVATNPNLSTAQKVGHSGRVATDAALSYAVPYYGLARGIGIAGQQMEKSGSPQVRGFGRTLDYAVEPSGAKGFWDVVGGDRSPKAAFKAQGGLEGLTLDLMGPIGLILRGTGVHLPGLYHEPTTGTKMRSEIDRLAQHVPEIKGFKMQRDALSPDEYNAFNSASKAAAYEMATAMGHYAKDYSKDPKSYQIQLGNSLLKTYGDGIVDLWKRTQPMLAPPTTTRVQGT